MRITSENYESFFIDYIEGNLPESMIDQFLDFLNQNPDLKEELHLFEEVNLLEEQVVFQEKEQLYKSAADESHRLETSVVAYMEGDMGVNENKIFEAYLAVHPELKKEYDLFGKTRLIPDSKIIFPEKRKLHRKSGIAIGMAWMARAAAVLVLVWGINSVIQTQNTQGLGKRKQELAEVSPKPVSTIKEAGSGKSNQVTSFSMRNKSEKAKTIQEQTKVEPEEKLPLQSDSTDRDLTALAQINPISVKLDQGSTESQLAFSHPVNLERINEPKNIMSVEEFLAYRAKKVGKEGLFSAQRIARLGLNLASEISGKRIGYKMKDGKITSVGFESKLMAFSIPLEKE
jgi:hypothetical protein